MFLMGNTNMCAGDPIINKHIVTCSLAIVAISDP